MLLNRTLIGFAALIIIAGTSCKKKAEDLQGGTITAVSGDVRIESAAGVSRRITTQNLFTKESFFMPGEVLVTEKASLVDMQFAAGQVVRIGESTRVKLSGARILSGENFSQVLMDLKQGKVFVRSDKISSTSVFTIATPTAIASVRGTEFLINEEKGSSETLVQDGSVQVSDENLENPDVVDEGNKAEVEQNGEVEVNPLDEDDKKELADISNNIQTIQADAQARIQDIIANFEENKARIQQALEEQKKVNESVIQNQRDRDANLIQNQQERDKTMLQDQIRRDREMMDRIRGSSQEQTDAMKRGAQEKSDAIQSGGNENMDKIRQSGGGASQDSTRSQMDKIRNPTKPAQ